MIAPVTCWHCGKEIGIAYTPRDITRLRTTHDKKCKGVKNG